MRLDFQTLTIEHFRCFSAKQTFDLAPSPGLWFLRGKNEVEPALSSNGSGKSSLVECLFWVLTGRTSKGLRNPDLKPWVRKGTPKGELSLLIDGEPTVITRVATTNGLSINGKEVGPEEALKLLGMSPELLLNTTFLAQGQPLFFDRTPKEKMQLFTDVLRYERWEERSARASDKVRELERLEAELEGELAGTKSALEQTERLQVRSKESAEEWETERQQRGVSLEKEIKTLEGQLESAEERLGEIELAHDGAWLKLREMREDVKSLEKTFGSAQATRQAEEAELSGFQRDLQRLIRELRELGETDTCPVCSQPVKGTDFGAHKEELREEIAELSRKIKRGIPKNIITLHEGAAGALTNFRAELSTAERDTDSLQSKLLLAKPNTQRIKTELHGLKAQRQSKDQESNPYTEQLQTLRKQKRTQEAVLEALEEDLGKARRQAERTKFWIRGFRDVALFLLEEVLAELEAVTNSLLIEVGLEGWTVKYDVERETKSGSIQRGINVLVIPVGQGLAGRGKPGLGKARRGAARQGVGEGEPSYSPSQPIKWEAWSGGEGQRLRLVGALALSDVLLRHAGVSTNLEIYDEPSQHLSAAGVSDLCRYLADRALTYGKTAWMVDHTAREGAVFAGTVTVTKTEKGSVLS